MIKDIFVIKAINLAIYFILVYFASFAIPTGALFFVLTFSSITANFYELVLIFAITYITTLLGDISTYFFAKLFSKQADRFFKINKTLSKNEEKVHHFIGKYGFYAIFFTRFIMSGLGPVVNYYCGIKKYNFKTFFKAILFGEFLYAFIFITLGVIFKNFINEILNLINGIFIVIFLLIAIYYTYKQLMKEIRSS